MKKAQTVWVKNNGAEPFSDRYDGEDFTIAPGEAVEMLAECATLCLGFGEEDKARVLRRRGWAFTVEAQKQGEKRLDEFSFHMSERESRGERPVPIPPVRRRKESLAAPAIEGTSPAFASSEDAGEESDSALPTGQVNPLEKLARATAAAG